MTDKSQTIYKILSDFKARDIRIYDIGAISSIADAFILATGDAGKHIDAMAEAVRQAFKEESSVRGSSGRTRGSVEGDGKSGWVLIDLGDIVVHLFTADRRSYYALDELWSETAQAANL